MAEQQSIEKIPTISPEAYALYLRSLTTSGQLADLDRALSEEQLASIKTPTLIVHGVHDDIVPLEQTSLRMVKLLPDADLIVFGRVGHWTQIERAEDFQQQVGAFFAPMTTK